MVKKSPSALRKFGKTFGKGLSMVGKTLWSGISKASRNLDRNAPEFKEFSKTMTAQPKQSRPPQTDLDKMFFPRPIPRPRSIPRQISKKKIPIPRQIPKKKSKKRKIKARRMVYAQPKQEMPSWGLP